MTDTLPTLRSWLPAVVLVLLSWLALAILLDPTAASMVAIWDSSETYAHGYVVLPLSLWLVWRDRAKLAILTPSPDFRALIPAAAIGALWLFGRVAGALLIEHYALVALMITTVWAFMGWPIVRAIWFPLGYLLLMVPVGDFLVWPLIDFTADFTVFMLQTIGIPVYREGTFFSIPSGEWSVVSGCSGIRYILASMVLGLLYAYLTYITWWKRLAFIAASLIVPVFANGMRATMIVLIAHFSDMKLALGVDHFIYGWVWFGIVMISMFWIGNIWREDAQVSTEATQLTLPAITKRGPTVAVALALLLVFAAFPFYERHLSVHAPLPSPLAQFSAGKGWQFIEAPITNWEPRWKGMDDARTVYLQKGHDQVMLYLAWYGTQKQGSELINYENQLVEEKHPEWRKPSETSWTAHINGTLLAVRRGILESQLSGQRLVAWYWNRIDRQDNIDNAQGKLRLAWNKLTGQEDAGAVVIVTAPYVEKPEEADATLTRFLADLHGDIDATLDPKAVASE